MIGFPKEGFDQYDFIRKQTKDRESKENLEFPVEYMFKEVPKELPADDPISVTLHEMDRFGIEKGMVGVSDETAQLALKQHPDRFIASGAIFDPNDVVGSVRTLRREYEEFGIRSTSVFPAGGVPASAHRRSEDVPHLRDMRRVGLTHLRLRRHTRPRVPFASQEVARIDIVMFDFPDLVFVTRHGCEPWRNSRSS